MRCMTIELRETEVTALLRKGFLNEEARNNRRAVKSAFYGFLDGTLNYVTRNGGPNVMRTGGPTGSPLRSWRMTA